MVARDITAVIARAGGVEAVVLERTADSVDEFNNTEWAFSTVDDGEGGDVTAFCTRTYPNRNTEAKSNYGDRKQDIPVFLFPNDEWQKVGSSARIRYPEEGGGTTTYELQSPTRWPTHVEIFGEEVVN